ncbi:MAG: hypothetical protein ABIJ97_15805 [Bacteroidota bacterium]
MKKLLFSLPVFILLLFSCGETSVDLASVDRVDGKVILKNQDKPYSGQVEMFYENGNKKFQETLKNGTKDGKYLSYFKTGQKKTEGKYINGKRDGIWKWWNEKGEVSFQLDYSSNISLRF